MLIRAIVFPLGSSLRQPNNSLSHRVAALMIKPGEARDRLTDGIFINGDENDITGCLEDALLKSISAEPIQRHLRAAGLFKPDLVDYTEWVSELVAENHISSDQASILRDAQIATRKVIMVDEFTPEQMVAAAPKKKRAKKKK